MDNMLRSIVGLTKTRSWKEVKDKATRAIQIKQIFDEARRILAETNKTLSELEKEAEAEEENGS
jgi:hypothetical protein